MNSLRLFCLHISTLLIIFAGATTVSAVPADPPSPQSEPSIIGGKEAKPNAWPSMAAIVHADKPDAYAGQYCGGTLITSEWVLTAAHCLYDEFTNQLMQADEIDVVLGRHILSSDEGERIGAIQVIPHPEYNQNTDENDIGLIRLRQVQDSDVIALAQPHVARRVEADNRSATVIGWGTRNYPSIDFADALHQVTVPIVSNTTCISAMTPDPITNSMMCAGLLEGGKDACTGDSGGPLMVSSGEEWIQIGIVSWGKRCAQPNLYGVYTRVSDYFEWIEVQTGELAPLPFDPAAVALHKTDASPVQSWLSLSLTTVTITVMLSIVTFKLMNREQYANWRTK